MDYYFFLIYFGGVPSLWKKTKVFFWFTPFKLMDLFTAKLFLDYVYLKDMYITLKGIESVYISVKNCL